MSLTIDDFISFIHPTLLNAIIEVNTPDGGNPPNADELKLFIKAIEKSNKRYNSLTSNMPAKATIRFDSDTYQLKVALCNIYEYVLQDDALLHALSLQSMSLSENQVFDNYFQLLKLEREEIEDMEKKLLDEIKDKEDDVKNMGVLLYHRYPTRPRGWWLNGRHLKWR